MGVAVNNGRGYYIRAWMYSLSSRDDDCLL